MKNIFLLFIIISLFFSCKSKQKNNPSQNINVSTKEDREKVVSVNKDYFISENIIGDITQEIVDLKGVETLCYIIKTNSQATEHDMGPWCPRHINLDPRRRGRHRRPPAGGAGAALPRPTLRDARDTVQHEVG